MSDPIQHTAAPPAAPATTATTSDPTPKPAEPGFFGRLGEGLSDAASAVGHAAAGAVHGLGSAIESILPEAEHAAETIAADELPAAARFALVYLNRNKAEYANKVASAIVDVVLSKVPGIDLVAPELTPLIMSEFDTLAGVLESELKTLATPATTPTGGAK